MRRIIYVALLLVVAVPKLASAQIRIVDEFKTSEYLERAQKRLKELTAK